MRKEEKPKRRYLKVGLYLVMALTIVGSVMYVNNLMQQHPSDNVCNINNIKANHILSLTQNYTPEQINALAEKVHTDLVHRGIC